MVVEVGYWYGEVVEALAGISSMPFRDAMILEQESKDDSKERHGNGAYCTTDIGRDDDPRWEVTLGPCVLSIVPRVVDRDGYVFKPVYWDYRTINTVW